jgi:tetratricopeptide (TPR) repeat protein
MTDIATLEQLTKENPLDYGYWNDLGIEYKKQGRLKDVVPAYLRGVNAIFQNIYLQLKNSRDNDFFELETLGDKGNHKFWLNRTIDCIAAYAKTDGINSVRFPDGQIAIKFSDKSTYGGLLYIDKDNARYVLPNFIHTFADCLTWNKIYAIYLNNIGVAYAEMRNYDKAREYFKEAIAFTPKGIDYPNPTIGLKELNFDE